uniref:Uncharacterized protein n=1 Tax=Arion vulgaris TaxID=1028688 RepID=A0A0B6Y0H4_9EUPU
MDFRAFDESLEKLRELEALSHEFKMSERQLQIINNDIIHTEQEVNKLRLEWEWCFNITGRKFLSPEKQAVKICEELVSHPELLEDTVKAQNEED